jgi:hypothetical protein
MRRALIYLAPLPALAVGAWAAHQNGIDVQAFLPNALAMVLGVLLVLLLAVPRSARVLPWLAAAGIGSTLLGPELEGVTRWLDLGPAHLHMSAALAPLLLLGLRHPGAAGPALVLGAQGVHLAQPDAAQATALALGALPLLLTRRRRGEGALVAATLLGLAAATWYRVDPLHPLAHVEGILGLIADQGLPGITAAGGAGVALLAPLLAGGKAAGVALPAGGLLYLGGSTGAASVGDFPVPVFGAGAGPVLGWYALIAVLISARGGRR